MLSEKVLYFYSGNFEDKKKLSYFFDFLEFRHKKGVFLLPPYIFCLVSLGMKLR